MQYNPETNNFDTVTNNFDTWLSKIKNETPIVKKEISDFFEMANLQGLRLNDLSKSSTTVFDGFCKKYKIADNDLKTFLRTWDGVGDVSQSYQQWMKKNFETTLTFSSITQKASSLFKGFLAGLGSMGVNAAIGFIIDLAATGIYNLIHADEQAIEASNNAKEAISNLKSEAQQTAEAAKEVGQEYSQLAQGINQIDNTNMSLSTDEYENFLDLSNQLAELFPTLIRGYDDQGNAILSLSGNMDEINEKIQNQIDKKKELNSLEQYQAFMGEGVDENGVELEDGYYTGAKIKADNIADSKKIRKIR